MFDALFNFLPLGPDLDRIAATPSRSVADIPWEEDARLMFDEYIEKQPLLVRISAAKQLRDRIEIRAIREARARVELADIESELATI
jgi:chlorophyllide a reductase subunit Z